MNPAVLKALIEGLKHSGRFLGLGAKTVGRKPFVKKPEWVGKRPAWQREYPEGKPPRGGQFDWQKHPRQEPGHINKLYMKPTTRAGTIARVGGLTAGGLTGLGLLSGGEGEQSQQTNPVASALLGKPASEWQPDPNIASRVQFQKNTQAKYNRQMKKLLLNYGIVNLINPESGEDMLKIGMAILEQNIAASGDTRQAKIFDSVFKSGSMPKTARAAAERILKAGGTNDDVKDITGIYADSAPKAPDYSKDESNIMMLRTVKALLDAGADTQARDMILRYIMSGSLDAAELPQGTNMSPDDQADAWLEIINGAPVGTGGSSGIQISSRTTG